MSRSNMSSEADGRKVVDMKVVILGNPGVGKTCLTNQYARGQFTGTTTTTIGAAYVQKLIDVDKNHRVSLQIWDTAGQERFRSMLPMYYKKAQAAILVYDVTDPSTMEKLPEWVTELHNRAPPNILLTIAANKCDMITDGSNSATFEEASKYANSINATIYETSAKTGQGIDSLFADLVQQLFNRYLAGESENEKIVDKVDINSKNSGGGCC